ncbi:MAG TPA: tetratricopeptide repeat-containing diguanylate cyclase [Rhodanobacteraceae bacterium]|nr:tetratricopeptide repeat-containing diguanylate cyclase [Rhodanobacteraceae bacterium]
MLSAAACTFAAPPAQADDDSRYPRAAVAASALRIAQSIADALASPASSAFVRGIGGRSAEAAEAWITGNVFSAVGAMAPADREWQRVAELARAAGNRKRLAAALSQRIEIALSQGDYARCETLADELADVARASGDTTASAFAEANLGVVERRRGHLDLALAHQQRALDLYRGANDSYGAAQSLASLATVYRDRGDFATALDMALESVALRERTGDGLDNAYRNVALLYREIEDADAARAYFERARDAAAKRGSPSAYSTVIGAYAGLLNDLGEFSAAQDASKEALAIDDAIGDRPHQGLEHLELGRALFGQHDNNAASGELESALALGRELGQRETVARSLLHLADIAMQEHDRLRAHGLLDEAIAGLESARLRPQLAQAYALREQLARADHDDAEALRFAHKYAAEREELLGVRASRQLAALETRHARAEAEQRVALLAKDNELKVALLARQQLERRVYLAATIGLAALLLLMAWRFVGVRRLNTALGRRNAEIERQRIALAGANDRLERQASALYQAAITDSMTGVANRAHSLDQLARNVVACARDGRELALLLIDFDHFKEINDAHGHLFGDNVLIAGVEAMRRCLRSDDLLGRIGGEEFVAIIVDRAPDDVVALAERLRLRVAEKIGERCSELRDAATVSIGIARLAELDPPPRLEALLEAADKALYAAKSAGRNRVQRYAA